MHAVNHKKGGFVTIRHSEIRNFNVDILKQACNNVRVEPQLQPKMEKHVSHGSVTRDEAHLGILELEVLAQWSESAIFDMCDKHKCRFGQSTIVKSDLSMSQTEKKRKYNDRVMNTKQETFTPLVCSTSGGLGNKYQTFMDI